MLSEKAPLFSPCSEQNVHRLATGLSLGSKWGARWVPALKLEFQAIASMGEGLRHGDLLERRLRLPLVVFGVLNERSAGLRLWSTEFCPYCIQTKGGIRISTIEDSCGRRIVCVYLPSQAQMRFSGGRDLDSRRPNWRPRGTRARGLVPGVRLPQRSWACRLSRLFSKSTSGRSSVVVSLDPPERYRELESSVFAVAAPPQRTTCARLCPRGTLVMRSGMTGTAFLRPLEKKA
jgi:hypothetical protein